MKAPAWTLHSPQTNFSQQDKILSEFLALEVAVCSGIVRYRENLKKKHLDDPVPNGDFPGTSLSWYRIIGIGYHLRKYRLKTHYTKTFCS
jgi:hypothetical protein